jgi:hypothetical protein
MVKAKKCNKPVVVESVSESDSSDSEYSEPIPVKNRKPRKKIVNEFVQIPKVKRSKTLIPDVFEDSKMAKHVIPIVRSVSVDIPKKKKRAPSAYNIYIQNKMKNDTDIKVLPIKERFKACAAAYKYDKANGNL